MTEDKTTIWCYESTKEQLDKPEGVTWDYRLKQLIEQAEE
jgi:hypothetical protein